MIHIQSRRNKLSSLPTSHPTPDPTGDVVKTTLKYDWCNSILSNYKKMEKPQHTVLYLNVHYYRQEQKYYDQEYHL